jgi:hypothetical protein
MKTCSIQSLQNGDTFEIPSLKDSMRNLKVCSIGSCSASVKGEKRDGFGDENDQWKPFSYAIALSTQVVWTGKGEVEEVKSETDSSAPAKRGRKSKIQKAAKVIDPAAPKRKRGRPANPNKKVVKKGGAKGRPSKGLDIKFPDGEWTIDDVVKLSGKKCKKYDVINYLAKMEKAGTPIKMKEVGEKRTAARGRATKIYKLI